MGRTTRLVFLSLTAFLLLAPLAVPKLGMPATLKADEPAYYLMARSLIEDRDLRCETKDLNRLYDAYPHVAVQNLILGSTDGWQTVFFGKPYIYSALAAPAAAVFGASGMVAFNMALFLAMIWMGYFYLRRYNSEGLAGLFAVAFFLFSTAIASSICLHTEILNMFSVAACLFFAFYRSGETPPATRSPGYRFWGRLVEWPLWLVWSGAALSLGVYNKPMLLLLGVPALYACARRRGAKGAVVWLLALAVSLGAIAGVSQLLIGKPTPYLGTARAGLKIEDPERLEDVIRPFRRPAASQVNHASWTWLARVPKVYPRLLAENSGYFLWGRHTGLLPYMPFAVLALVLFGVNGRKRVSRWLVLGSLGAIALFFLMWIDFNWHGGAGFVGNRYFVNVYPAFLFLVTRIRPDWLVAVGAVAGGLFLGPLVFSPYGASVPEPTLQSHARGRAFELLPIEQSLRRQIPGYSTFASRGLTFRGRKDLVRVNTGDRSTLWIRGASTAEIWISTARPIKSLWFEVSSLATENTVTLALGDARQTVHFDAATPEAERKVEVALKPGKPTGVRHQYGKKMHTYLLEVATATGRNPRRPDGRVILPQFYLGAELTLLKAPRRREAPAD